MKSRFVNGILVSLAVLRFACTSHNNLESHSSHHTTTARGNYGFMQATRTWVVSPGASSNSTPTPANRTGVCGRSV